MQKPSTACKKSLGYANCIKIGSVCHITTTGMIQSHTFLFSLQKG